MIDFIMGSNFMTKLLAKLAAVALSISVLMTSVLGSEAHAQIKQ